MMLVFTLGSMQPIYAQGWLKALGEIAKGVLESDDASDNTAKVPLTQVLLATKPFIREV